MFWGGKLLVAQRGSQNYIAAQEKIASAMSSVRRETARLEKENDKLLADMGKDTDKHSSQDTEEQLKAWAKGTNEWMKSLQSLADIQRKWRDSAEEAAIQQDAATGRISKAAEAQQIAAVHTREYAESLKLLQDQLASVQDGPMHNAQVMELQRQMADLNGRRVVEIMRDQSNEAATTWQGALGNAMNLWVQNARDSAKQVSEVFTTTLNGLNTNFAAAIMGDKTNFGGVFKGLGQQVLTIGMQRVESSLLGGMGAGKVDGSKGNPFHVVVENQGTKMTAELGMPKLGPAVSRSVAPSIAQALPKFSVPWPTDASTFDPNAAQKQADGSLDQALGDVLKRDDPMGSPDGAQNAAGGSYDVYNPAHATWLSRLVGGGLSILGGLLFPGGMGGPLFKDALGYFFGSGDPSASGGIFGGHRALGGKVKAGMTYDIGEMGREEFTPDEDGTITPNNKLGGAAYYNISVPDGVTPEAMHQYVQSALRVAHPQVVRSSVAAMHEAQRRRAYNAR